ncbi:asparagine synthetase domain-containing protein 1-like isoform X3 [Eriocheir sinensis]|uniref:asparagine synthetase domain-containing protein 1-like isoform X3 n=1 Tax=Eriocheir sinensis TaxID=95602 RepID=UPI0021CA32B0|nr:asparagine synthetase domain-containing protein 1-like isoform X3 [Eriocheir sinensis]
MCGICFICDFENCAQELDGQKELLSHSLLCNRGPDAHSRELVSINEKISALFEGCVLWLQGPEPTPQPLLDPLGNVLLWNGDILAGHQVSGDKSDTQYVSERLASGEQESILSFLEDIKGPWALVYFHRPSLRLYFGRDVFGRHSLLWQLPSPQHPRLMVTSVWQQCDELQEIDVTEKELSLERERTIRHLVAPLASVLDDSIGCALWFAGRGQGSAKGLPYVSPSRVLLCGQGADEQLGGYSRHRGRFTTGGWLALLEEIEMEVARIHTRNLGRDNRILAHHGRAPRFPYLDEEVVSTLNEMPVWIKTNMLLGRGTGEKLLLRLVAATLGLSQAARLPKRAIQFGSRIAKLENHKEKGSDQCLRLKGDSSAQEVT